ncbi:MAG: glycosyltransferase [Firmicutes bacterium]|nr:glycosyltransferase [Bacillota bacterium]
MQKIYISLTSHPPRIPMLHRTIDTLLRQTVSPAGIYLFLSTLQFPHGERDLTPQLLEQAKKGITIQFCDDDLRQHKKYYYIMQKYPNDLIIVVDDDMYYPLNLVARLYESYKANPQAIHAMCARQLETNDEKTKILPNEFCQRKFAVGVPSMKLMPIGFGGTLYPPNSLHSEVFNLNVLKQMGTDDYWLKIMSTMNNTPIVALNPQRYAKSTFPNNYTVKGSQIVAMKYVNVGENKYDFYLTKMLQLYNNYHDKNDTLVNRISRHLPATQNIKTLGLCPKPRKDARALDPQFLLDRVDTKDTKISVVISVNESNQQFLSTSLHRIVNQTLQEIEIICSSELAEVENIAKAANDSRIKISTAKNYMGKYIIFLQASDFCEPTALEKLYNRAEQDEADICLCNLQNYVDKSLSYNESNREMFKLDLLPFSHRDLPNNPHYSLSKATTENKLFRKNFLQEKQIEISSESSENNGIGFITMIKADRITMVDDFLITKISGEFSENLANLANSENSANPPNFETPIFSVAVFVGDSKIFTKECLLSVVNQTLQNIEIICINVGATAESWAIAQDFAKNDNRFTLLNEKNVDINKTICKVAKIAKGEYLQFVDSFDLLAFCALEHLYQKCDKSQNIEIIFHREKLFFDSAAAFAKYPINAANSVAIEKITTGEKFLEMISADKNFSFDIKFCCMKTSLLKNIANIYENYENGESFANFENGENFSSGAYRILLDLLSAATAVDFHSESLYLQRISTNENLWSSLYAVHANIVNLENLMSSYKTDKTDKKAETLAEYNAILQNTKTAQRNIFRKLYETLPEYKRKSALNVLLQLDGSQKELIMPIIAELFIAKNKLTGNRQNANVGWLKSLKIVRFFQCWSDHGLKYTVYRTLGKVQGKI